MSPPDAPGGAYADGYDFGWAEERERVTDEDGTVTIERERYAQIPALARTNALRDTRKGKNADAPSPRFGGIEVPGLVGPALVGLAISD